MATHTNYRECLIFIRKDVIQDELKKGTKSILEPNLASTMPKSNRVINRIKPGWGNGENIYMRIKGTNMLLMHIKNGYCVIIPEYVHCCDGTKRSIIGDISDTYFSLCGKNNVISSGKFIRNNKLYRQIMALKYFGDKKKKVPSHLEVHHKYMRWLSTEESMKLVTKEAHSQICNGKKSHRDGRCIDSVQELENFLNAISCLNRKLEKLENADMHRIVHTA